MPYAIVQKSLEAPSVEQLVRAFRALPQLTDYDANTMAKDAFGILVQGLDLADAGRLLQALHAEGVEAEMVDGKSLPPLPPPKPLHRAECLPGAFLACDYLGRPAEIEWPHVILVAAGAVLLTEFKHTTRERLHHYDQDGIPVTVTEHREKEEQNHRLILELLLDVAPGRYHIAAEKFNFAYLGERLSQSRAANYVALVQDCLRYATSAIGNRGAEAQRRDPRSLLKYPSKHAFEEETVWLLWHHFASRRVGP